MTGITSAENKYAFRIFFPFNDIQQFMDIHYF